MNKGQLHRVMDRSRAAEWAFRKEQHEKKSQVGTEQQATVDFNIDREALDWGSADWEETGILDNPGEPSGGD